MIPLKTTLTINALSSGATGLGLIILANPIAELFGVSNTSIFIAVGVFLVLFAAFVFMVGLSKSINNKAVRLIITLDALWVVASIALVAIASSSISLIGILIILAVAFWVAAMAFLQNKGMSSAVSLIIILCCLQSSVVAQPAEVKNSEVNSNTKTVEGEALQTVKSFLEAVKEMSHAKAFPLVDSMIQWHQPGNNRFSGVKNGTKEVFGMFRGFLNASASTLRLTEIKVLAVNGNQVACHLHWSAAQPAGSILDVDNIDVYTVENGRIVKAVVYSADLDNEDRFWLK